MAQRGQPPLPTHTEDYVGINQTYQQHQMKKNSRHNTIGTCEFVNQTQGLLSCKYCANLFTIICESNKVPLRSPCSFKCHIIIDGYKNECPSINFNQKKDANQFHYDRRKLADRSVFWFRSRKTSNIHETCVCPYTRIAATQRSSCSQWITEFPAVVRSGSEDRYWRRVQPVTCSSGYSSH